MAASAPNAHPGNLPAGEFELVGRKRELSEAKRQLRRTRLLTLTGVGGVGKTRLARRVASDVRRAFPDGVWLVQLAALEDEGLIPQTVAAALGVRDQGARHPVDLLGDYLSGLRALVVLDNCEHLLDGCAVLSDRLLRVAPRVRILATSRQPLGVYGESVLSVPSLSVPELSRATRTTASLDRFEAIRLFSARAAAAHPGFALGPGNREAVARLCQRLDGIPLAIELAAVRLGELSPEQILHRLDERFELLTGGGVASLPRHETLRASIDWSFDLCSPGERALWVRTSVFAGGFDLEAAEAICADGDIVRDEVLDLVAGLVDKSIVEREDHGSRVRYRLLETIRQYGRDRLAASGEKPSLQRRHRDFYRRNVEQAEEEWLSPRQEEWLDWLDSENGNIRAALEFCLTEPGEAGAALDIAAALWAHWLYGGAFTEGRHWLGQALALAPDATVARAKALWVDGWLAVLKGDTEAAAPRLEECRVLAQRLGHAPTLNRSKQYLGGLALYQGDYQEAIALLEEAVAGHRAAGDRNGAMTTLYQLTMACAVARDPRAESFGEQCLALCESSGAPWSRTYALWALGLHAWGQGDSRRAADLVREALRTRWEMRDTWGMALCFEVLAWTAASAGAAERGARLLGAAEAIWRSVGTSRSGYRHLADGHEETAARVRAELGERAYGAAVRSGSRLTVDEAADYALHDPLEAAPGVPGGAAIGS